jgi:hypothetical protein
VVAARWAALGGAVFFGLILLHANLTTGAPAATDPAREMFAWVAEHHGRLQLDAAVYGFAMVAAGVWLSGLVRALRRAERGMDGPAIVAIAGGALAGAGTVAGALVEGTLANRYVDLGLTGVHVWWTMFLLSYGATLLGLVLLTGATALFSMRRPLFPHWFAFASALLAVLSAIGAVTIGYTSDGIQATAGIAVLLDCVWMLLVSIYLWRKPELAADPE